MGDVDRHTILWLVLGGAGVSLATSVVTGLMDLDANKYVKDNCSSDRDFCRVDDAAEHASRARTLAWVSTATLVVGAGAAVFAFVLPLEEKSPVSCNTPTEISQLAGPATFVASGGSRVVVGIEGGNVYAFQATPSMYKTLANVPGLTGLATDGLDAYWLSGALGKLMRRNVNTSGAVTDVATNLASPRDLVLDGDYLYWLETTSGTVRRCPKSDCTKPETVTRLATATRMALGDRVYLTSDSDSKIYAAPRP